MAYLTTIVCLIAIAFLIHECYEQMKLSEFKPIRLFVKSLIAVIVLQGSNYVNNKFLITTPAPPYKKEVYGGYVGGDLIDKSIKPMSTELRQERADSLIDRKQITNKLYEPSGE